MAEIFAFQKFFALPITNDESERIVLRTVLYANFNPKAYSDFQVQLRSLGNSLKRLPRCKSKKDFVEGFKKDPHC